MIEEWRSVSDFPNYEVSSHGRVRRVAGDPRGRGGMGVLKPRPSKYGHLGVVLRRGGVSFSRKVHSLVCEAFHGPRPAGKWCAHGDGNPVNNVPSNLRWATPKENSADRKIHGTEIYGERAPRSRLTAEQVYEIRDRLDAGESALSVARAYGVSGPSAWRIGTRKSWSHLPERKTGLADRKYMPLRGARLRVVQR